MKQYKTINEVIRKGQIIVNVPVSIIMISIPVFITLGISKIAPAKYMEIGIFIGAIGGIALGFLLGWTWWSFTIAKWRIWAFENIKKSDWNTLKQRAIKDKLIWEDGNKFEKTEIRNKKENEKIEIINLEIGKTQNNESLNNILNDPRVPKRIDYTFKKSEKIASLILPLFFIGIGIFMLTSKNFFIGIILIGLGIYSIDLYKIKNLFNEETQLTISDEGIEMKKFKQIGFVKWNDTEDISVDTINGILNLNVFKGDSFYEVAFNLNEYKIGDYSEFLRIINIYLKINLDAEK